MSSSTAIEEIEPTRLHALLTSNASVLLLDVRQIEEHERVALPDSHLIPLMELPQRWEEVLPKIKSSETTVVYCRVGGRSALAVEFLQSMGLTGIKNLRGGINAYALEADTSLDPY